MVGKVVQLKPSTLGVVDHEIRTIERKHYIRRAIEYGAHREVNGEGACIQPSVHGIAWGWPGGVRAVAVNELECRAWIAGCGEQQEGENSRSHDQHAGAQA
jgi:hypothetical protein